MTELTDVMTLYAQKGIEDWRKASDDIRNRAKNCLGTAGIADDVREARETIYTVYNGANQDKLRFIPMPEKPGGKVDRSFFLPIREMENGAEKIAFDLFLLVKESKCLGFRLELPHAKPTSHGYTHVQLTKTFLRRTLPVTGIPEWLPDSYPAFPLPPSTPVRLFLTMATAMHGYDKGALAILGEIFSLAGRSAGAAPYMEELKQMLG